MQQEPQPGTDLGAAIGQQFGVTRSQEWDKVRRKHLELAEQSYCAVCHGTAQPQVHHIVPFHFCHLVYRGDLELDERNLMTLCEVQQNNHHLLLGHLGDWEIYNPGGRDVIVGAFQGVPAEELTADKIILTQTWKQWIESKPLAWGAMSDNDKRTLRQFLDTHLPYIPTPDYPAPFPFMQSGDDGKDPNKIPTTYGSRWPVFLQQVETAATDTAAQTQ